MVNETKIIGPQVPLSVIKLASLPKRTDASPLDETTYVLASYPGADPQRLGTRLRTYVSVLVLYDGATRLHSMKLTDTG